MQRFGEGLDHLLRDRLEEAAASIESGLALPVLNESLNTDMRMLLNSYTGKLQ